MANVDRRLDPSDPINILDRRVQRLEDKLENLDVEGSLNMTLIEDVILGSDQADITFTGIPAHFRHLRLMGFLRSDRSGFAGESVGVRLNGNTSNIYYSHRARHNTVDGLLTSEQVGTDFWSLVGVLGADAPATAYGSLDYIFPSYARDDIHKVATGYTHKLLSTSSGGPEFEFAGGTWRSTAAITQIKLYPAAGGTVWIAGSRLSLYGIG